MVRRKPQFYRTRWPPGQAGFGRESAAEKMSLPQRGGSSRA